MPIFRHLNTGAVLAERLDDLADLRRRWTVAGAPTMTASAFGSALTLDGAADYLKRTYANWRSQDSLGSIAGWIKLDATGAFYSIFTSCDEAGLDNIFTFWVHNAGVIAVYTIIAGVVTDVRGSTTLVADRWYHVALVSDGSAYSLYVDGESETLSIIAGANTGDWFADVGSRDNIIIGARQYNALDSYFSGSMRDLLIYPRILTVTEVLALATHKAF